MNNNHNVFPCNELGMGDSKSELERLLELCESTPQTGEPNPQIAKEGANKRGNSSRLTQSFHFFMFEPIFSPVNALNQPI
ncbi:TPA: hypothetical protein ACVWYC_002767 [Klebsiella pneumoniae]